MNKITKGLTNVVYFAIGVGVAISNKTKAWRSK
jgi:hypothetical protein